MTIGPRTDGGIPPNAPHLVAGGGGGDSVPLSNSRTSGRTDGGDATLGSSERVLFNETLTKNPNEVTNQVTTRSKFKTVIFAISATKTGLIIPANPNFDKMLLKGWIRHRMSIGFILRKRQSQGHVK